MIDRLVRGLAIGSGLTAEEIMDVLWLAASQPPAQATGQVPPRSEREGSLPQGTSEPDAGDSPFTSGPPSQDGGIPLRLGGAGPGNGAGAGELMPATEVGFGAPQPIRDALAMPRALRRLRQVRAPARYPTVDIDATVEATAQAGGRFLPVFTRRLERGLDLVLVVDGSASMRIWDDTFAEFERLLVQTGAFRSVSRLKLVVQDRAVILEDPSGASHPPRRLVDPSGMRVILIATDASSQSWYTREPWDMIASWCAMMPVALIQVLPQHYWAATALGEPYITTRAPRPAAPNRDYPRRLAWWAQDPGGLALPVVTLAPGALESWAQAAVSGTAWTPGITATPPDPEYAPSAAFTGAGAETLVNDFLSRASPGAERLARILASAPALSIPLISVLQESLAPQTGVPELAEILSGSLLENTASSSGQQIFRFRQGTREILQRGITTFEEWDTYSAVSRYLREHHRLGGPLQARLPDADGTSSLDQGEDPFSELHETLVTRLGLRTIPVQQPPREREAAAEPIPVRHPPATAGDRPPLHDYSRSRAVLIGTSDYEFLPPMPAAANSLSRMANLLTSPLCGWPPDRVVMIANRPGPGDIADTLIAAFEDIDDVALFYFVGHSQLTLDDELCLGLVRSRQEPSRRAATSLGFGAVRRALRYSSAKTKIVILDCAFAGWVIAEELGSSSSSSEPITAPGSSAADLTATGTLGDSSAMLDLTAGTDTYTIAATSAYAIASFQDPQGLTRPQTDFTRYLADLVERGIPGQPSRLGLDQVVKRVRDDLAADQLPAPSSRAVGRARDFAFAYNAASPETIRDPANRDPELPEGISGFGSWLLWMIATRAAGLVNSVYTSGRTHGSRGYGSVDGHPVPTPSLIAWLLVAAERRLTPDALPQDDPELVKRQQTLRAMVSRALNGEPRTFRESWLHELADLCGFSDADLEFLLANRQDVTRTREERERENANLREAITRSLRSSPEPGPLPAAVAYADAIQTPGAAFTVPELQNAQFARDSFGLPLMASGSRAIVFKAEVTGRPLAVRCYTRNVEGRERYLALAAFLADHDLNPHVSLPTWLDSGIRVNGSTWPVVLMDWIEGRHLDGYVSSLLGKSAALNVLAERWRELIRTLQQAGFAHGGLQHADILIDQSGQVRLVDYDSVWVPAMAGLPQPAEGGHSNYEHPGRRAWGRWMDTFPALVIYLSLVALDRDPGLWSAFHDGRNLLFQAADFVAPIAGPVWLRLAALNDPEVDHLTRCLRTCCAPNWEAASLDETIALP